MPLHRLSDSVSSPKQTQANPKSDASNAEQPERRRRKIPIEQLDHDEAVARAKETLLNILSRAAKTEKELSDKLAQRGYPSHIIAEALDRLKEVGLVSDALYAENFASSRHHGRGLSASAIRRELARKGVDTDIIDEALLPITQADEKERARQLVRKKLPSLQGLDPQTQTRRLVSLLARRGYGPSIVFSTVREELSINESNQE